jgi:hypothetical protein
MNGPARTWNAVVVGEDTPCWSVARRHECLRACASHAAARCCRHDSFEPPAGGREVQTQIELCLAGRQTIPSGGFQYLQLGVVWSQ